MDIFVFCDVLVGLKKALLHWYTKELFLLAGTAGFGPANAGVKVRCLTAWRRPNIYDFNIIHDLGTFVKYFFQKIRKFFLKKRIFSPCISRNSLL